MLIKKHIILQAVFILIHCFFLSIDAIASTTKVTDNGKVATLILPLKAQITLDTIIRNTIKVMPLSSLYELIPWNQSTNRFHDHDFLVRIFKDKPTKIRLDIVNDQYTCSYANPNWGPIRKPGSVPNWTPVILPQDITSVNQGYSYKVKWSTGEKIISSGFAVIDETESTDSWLESLNKDRFIDLTLNIQFPDISRYPKLISNGGICRGSVTLLISDAL